MSRSSPSRLDRAIEILLLALLVYLPVAFGGVSLHRRGPAFVLAGVLLALLLWRAAGDGDDSQSPFWRDGAIRCWIGFLGLGALMLVPVPAFLARFLGVPGIALDGSWVPIHPAPEKGLIGWLTWLVALTGYLAVREVYRSRRQVSRLVGALLALGAFESVYGLIEWASGRQQIFGYVKRVYTDVATGTFINRNHYAAYIAMTLCLAVAAAADAIDRSERKGRAREGVWDKAVLVGFLLVLGMGAMLAAGSRAAPLCFLAATIAVGVVFQRRYMPKRIWPALLVLGAAFAVFLIWMGVEPLNPRYADVVREARVGDARLHVYWTSLGIWLQAPLIGTGLGSFADVFARSRPPTILATYDHAHCDYLEVLVETGLAGFLLLYGGVAIVLRRTIKAVRDRSSRFARSRSLGSLAAVAALGLHGFVDFNLSIPANLFTVFVLLALAQTCAERHLKESRR